MTKAHKSRSPKSKVQRRPYASIEKDARFGFQDQIGAALRQHAAGRLPEAEGMYRQILNAAPGHPVALHYLGVLAHQTGRNADAVELIGKALSAAPDYAEAHGNLGLALSALNRLDEASRSYRRALQLNPDHADAHNNLGNLLLHLGKFEEAIESYDKALAIKPDFHAAVQNQERARKSLLLKVLEAREGEACPRSAKDALLQAPPQQLHRMQVEVTSWCNLKCAGCMRTIDMDAGTWRDVHMPVERFAAVIENMRPSHTICLQGIGEPTLHPDFIEIVKTAQRSGKFQNITFNTNGLSRSIAYYQDAVDAGVNFISISVASLDPAIADACREGTTVEKLVKRIRELRALMGDAMLVSMVISRRNLDDVPNTLAFLDGLERPDGLAPLMVEFQTLIDFNDDGGESYALSEEDVERFAANLRAYAERFENLDLSTYGFARHTATVRCPRPFVSPYVTAEGYLTPCCVIEDPDVLGRVNVAEQPLAEAWRAPSVRTWLGGYLDRYPAICDGCCFRSHA